MEEELPGIDRRWGVRTDKGRKTEQLLDKKISKKVVGKQIIDLALEPLDASQRVLIQG